MTLFVLSFQLLSCGPTPPSSSETSETSETSESSQESTGVVSETQEEPKSNWLYEEDADKMTGDKSYYAICESTNTIEFDFPYNGGSTMGIQVRNRGKGNDVLITISKGQFMSNYDNSEFLRAKFDDEQPMNLSYIETADNSSDVIFVASANKFIAKLKTAKKLMLEAPFYDAGRQIGEFNLEGFEWTR
jgi:hypothetical protein